MSSVAVPEGITQSEAELVLAELASSRVSAERLAASLARIDPLPTPAAAAQATMVEARMRALDERLLDARGVSGVLGGSSTNKTMASRIEGLARVKRHGAFRYPDFQFLPGNVNRHALELVDRLRALGNDDHAIVLWFYAPNGSLPDRRTPADVLVDDPASVDALVAAAVADAQW